MENKNKKPSYWGILPAIVRYDLNLTCMQKIMFAEISALQNSKGVCFATNRYFSTLYNVHKNTAGKWINKLEREGYIKSQIIYKPNSKEVKERLLFVCIDPINQNIDTPITLIDDKYQQKKPDPINEKMEDNNTSFNNNTTTTIVNNISQNEALQIFQSMGFNSNDFVYEYKKFKLLNEDDSKRTKKNWKRWCYQIKEFDKKWN